MEGWKISLIDENEGKIDHLVWLVFGAISHDDNLHPSTCLGIIVKKKVVIAVKPSHSHDWFSSLLSHESTHPTKLISITHKFFFLSFLIHSWHCSINIDTWYIKSSHSKGIKSVEYSSLWSTIAAMETDGNWTTRFWKFK